jgi:hypothetical protein
MLDRFAEWRDDYVRDLNEEQFVREAKKMLRPELGNSVDRTFIAEALSRLYRFPSHALSRETAFCRHLKPDEENVIRAHVFRGEHGAGEPLQSRRACFSFSQYDIAESYATSPNDEDDIVSHPRIIEANIEIRNPVISDLEDPFVDGIVLMGILGAARTRVLFKEQEQYLTNTSNFTEVCEEYGVDEDFDQLYAVAGDAVLSKLYIDAYPVFDNQKYVQWFMEAGFDGLVQGGNGDSALEAEYKVFHVDQIAILKVHDLRPSPVLELDEQLLRQRQTRNAPA